MKRTTGGLIGVGVWVALFVVAVVVGWIPVDGRFWLAILGLVFVSTVLGFWLGWAAVGIIGVVDELKNPKPQPLVNGWTLQERWCDHSVDRFHRVLAVAADPSLQEWLVGAGRQLDAEMGEVRKLIAEGRYLDSFAGPNGPDKPEAKRIWDDVASRGRDFEFFADKAESLDGTRPLSRQNSLD
jgi:hypothetical protein